MCPQEEELEKLISDFLLAAYTGKGGECIEQFKRDLLDLMRRWALASVRDGMAF